MRRDHLGFLPASIGCGLPSTSASHTFVRSVSLDGTRLPTCAPSAMALRLDRPAPPVSRLKKQPWGLCLWLQVAPRQILHPHSAMLPEDSHRTSVLLSLSPFPRSCRYGEGGYRIQCQAAQWGNDEMDIPPEIVPAREQPMQRVTVPALG